MEAYYYVLMCSGQWLL